MIELHKKHCIPCSGSTKPLVQENIVLLLKQLQSGWNVIEDHRLEKEYKFKDFKEGLNFINKVGELAEQEGHHPDLFLSWGKVKVVLWTHKIDGLSENDFILASKCDSVYGKFL